MSDAVPPKRKPVPPPRQSPRGHGCTAIFDSISFRVGAPAHLRDGS